MEILGYRQVVSQVLLAKVHQDLTARDHRGFTPQTSQTATRPEI